jgi:hypothetical protein
MLVLMLWNTPQWNLVLLLLLLLLSRFLLGLVAALVGSFLTL